MKRMECVCVLLLSFSVVSGVCVRGGGWGGVVMIAWLICDCA